MTARMIQTAVELLPEPDEAWKALAANGIEMRNSRPLTVQLAVVAIAPALTAASASYPWRWKNLTRSAKTATSPPTSAVKMLEVSSATHRPNGIWPTAAPVSAQPSGTTGSVAKTNVRATQPQLAPLMASRELPYRRRMVHYPAAFERRATIVAGRGASAETRPSSLRNCRTGPAGD